MPKSFRRHLSASRKRESQLFGFNFFWVMYEPSFLRRREFCPLFSSFGFSDKFLRFPGLDSRFRGNDGGWFLFF